MIPRKFSGVQKFLQTHPSHAKVTNGGGIELLLKELGEKEKAELLSFLSVEEIEEFVASGEFLEFYSVNRPLRKIPAAEWPSHLRDKPYEFE
jgi:hypothetical protein